MKKVKTVYDKETNEFKVLPKKKKRVLAIIMLENQFFVMRWISIKKDSFRFKNNMYFINPGSLYISKNGVITSFYQEGVSLPISHDYIEKEEMERSYLDEFGQKQTVTITGIKGLNYDSKVTDMILNRKLADAFTRVPFDLPGIVMIILLVGVLALGIVNLGVLLS